MKNKIFYFDVETTGTNSWKHDIIQLSGLVEIAGKVEKEFNFRIKPYDFSVIESEALAVNGITREQLEKYPEPADVYDNLIDILGIYIDKFDKKDKFYFGGFNVQFDIGFLKKFFENNGDKYFGSWFNWKKIDPLPLLHVMEFYGKIDLPDYKLATACEHFGIPLDAHDAMNDIRATRELMLKIQDQLKL